MFIKELGDYFSLGANVKVNTQYSHHSLSAPGFGVKTLIRHTADSLCSCATPSTGDFRMTFSDTETG